MSIKLVTTSFPNSFLYTEDSVLWLGGSLPLLLTPRNYGSLDEA
jgi:hypothetical protein